MKKCNRNKTREPLRMVKAMAAFILLGAALTLCACGSSDESEIKATLKNFTEACQGLDSSAMLECVDPSIAEPIQTGTNLLSVVGINIDSTLATLVSVLFGSDFTAEGGVLESLSINVKDIDMDQEGSSATALCTITWEEDGEESSQDAEISMIHTIHDGEAAWFISGIDLK